FLRSEIEVFPRASCGIITNGLGVSTELRRRAHEGAEVALGATSRYYSDQAIHSEFFTSEKTHGRNKKQPQQDESHGHARPRHGKIAQRPGAFDGHRQRGRREHALRSRFLRARPVYFFSAQKSQVRSHERL